MDPPELVIRPLLTSDYGKRP